MNLPGKNTMLISLEKRYRVAGARSWGFRLLKRPLKIFVSVVSRAIMPFRKNGIRIYARTFFGAKMQVMIPASIDIYLYGCKKMSAEYRLCRWMIDHIKTGSTVWDVGANFGFYTLFMHALVEEKGQVIAFEPFAPSFSILEKNVAGKANISIHEVGLIDRTGKAGLSVQGFKKTESNSFYHIPGADTIPVAVCTADEWQQENDRVPNLVKADIAGSEWMMIKGATAFCKRHFPVVILKIKKVNFESCSYPAIDWLTSNGYRMNSIDIDGQLLYCPDAWTYLQSNNLAADHFVFIPR